MILASSQRFIRRLFLCVLLILGGFLAGFSWVALSSFEKAFVPELQKKAQLIGEKINEDITRALGYGIPLQDLAGMGPYLEAFVQENADIGHIRIRSQERILFEPTPTERFEDPEKTLMLSAETGQQVYIEIFLSKAFLDEKFQTVALDQLTALFIALLIAFEVLCYIVYGRIFNPLEGMDQLFMRAGRGDFRHTLQARATSEMTRIERALNGFFFQLAEKRRDVLDNAQELKTAQIVESTRDQIDQLVARLKSRVQTAEPYGFQALAPKTLRSFRFSLFLFMFAEELSRPFLPLMAQGFVLPAFLDGNSQLAAGLPIALFMAMIVLISLISGPWLEKWGARRLFLIGTLPAILGYVGVYLSTDYGLFLCARALSALGYGLVFVAAQSYFASQSSDQDRASNMALFVGAILVAGITGPAIGGIMAFKIGYGETFLLSVVLVLLSVMFLSRSVTPDEQAVPTARPVSSQETRKGMVSLLGHLPFMSISLFCAIPAKIMLSGVLFLLTPLYLIEQGSNEATIGRVLILYGIVIVLMLPWVSKWADKVQNHNRKVIIGSLIAAGGALLFAFGSGLWVMAACVALVGLGQAFSMSTQLAEVQTILKKREPGVTMAQGMGVFRALERSGSVMGPLICGALALSFGIENTIMFIGAYALISVLIHTLLSLKTRQAEEAEHAASK